MKPIFFFGLFIFIFSASLCAQNADTAIYPKDSLKTLPIADSTGSVKKADSAKAVLADTNAVLLKNKYQTINLNNNFIGAGLGLAFETRFGLLNISYAAGKRNDVKLNLREASKIHFGYVNYF